MRRTREWWARLTAQERAELVRLDAAKRNADHLWASILYDYHHDPTMLYRCEACEELIVGRWMCRTCSDRREELIAKGDGKGSVK